MIIDLIMIGIITVYVIDYLNFADEMYNIIIKLIFGKGSPHHQLTKPFNCSLCMTFWMSLIYIYLYSNICIYTLFIICFNSLLTQLYYNSIVLIPTIIEKINTFINKNI